MPDAEKVVVTLERDPNGVYSITHIDGQGDLTILFRLARVVNYREYMAHVVRDLQDVANEIKDFSHQVSKLVDMLYKPGAANEP